MKRCVKRILPGLVLLLGLHPLWAAGVTASPPAAVDDPVWEAMRKEVSDTLRLTPPQAVRIEMIQADHQKRQAELASALAAKKLELQQRLQDAAGDLEPIRRSHQDLKTLTTALMDLRLETLLAIRGTLTPEQRTMLQDLYSRKFPGILPAPVTDDGQPDGAGR